MTEVRRHQRRTASGRTTTVRQHHRDAGGGGEPPPGAWYFRNHDDGRIYEALPDGSVRPLPDETEERRPPPQASELHDEAPQAQEPWWEDDEPEPARDYTLSDDAPHHARDVAQAQRERPDNPAFERMVQEMHDWRALGEPAAPPAEPGHSPLDRALGTDTQEGADRFARLGAYRDAGYDGPLDDDYRIPDPDDPRNWELIDMLADMRERRG